jgi:hypothetical protein
VLELVQFGPQFDDWRQPPMLAAELGELTWVLEPSRIGEGPFDFVGAREGGREPVTKGQESNASAGGRA